MAGSSNFTDHNPTNANQESDASYAADTTRTGGIVTDQVLPSPWLNKIWRQSSVFCAAFGDMMAAKGYTLSDAVRSTLAGVLANVMTFADLTVAAIVTALGFTPVQQGTGEGQLGNTVKIGWSAANRLRATVDVSDLGNIVFDINLFSTVPGDESQSLYLNGTTPPLMIKTGTVAMATGGAPTCSFVLPFPNACVGVVLCNLFNTVQTSAPSATVVDVGGFKYQCQNTNGAFWIAIGY